MKICKRAFAILLALVMVVGMLPAMALTSQATGYDNGYSGGMAGDGYIRCYGVDVSEHQGTGFNFQNLKNNGYSFVILRAGFVSRKDYRFEEYYTAAKAAGLDIGAYFYSYASSASEASYEADQCLSYISGKTFEYPIYFDFEDSSSNDGNANTAYSICRTFLDKIAAAGYLAGLYGYAGWMDPNYGAWVPTSTICGNKYECWIANYYDNTPTNTKSANYPSTYGMYQYTSSNYVGGVGPLDTNVCYKDYPTIVKTYGFNGYSSSAGLTINDGTYTISPSGDASFKVSVAGDSTENNANIQLGANRNELSQKFVFQAAGDGYYYITNAKSHKRLDVYCAYSDPGTNVIQYEANSSEGQLWMLEDAGDGLYYIKSKVGTYLDLANNNLSEGANIQMYTGNQSAAQKWHIDVTDTLTDGVYYVTVPEDNSFGWNIAGNNTENGANIQVWTNRHPVAIQHNSDNYYTMRFLLSDKYLDVSGSGTSNGTNLIQWADGSTENHKFLAIPNADGSYSFVAKCNGLYIDRDGGGTPSNGQNVQCYTGNGTAAQNWSLVPYAVLKDGTYQIGGYSDSSFVFDVTGHSNDEGALLQLLKDEDANGQRFAIEYKGNGDYAIRDINSNYYVDVYEGEKLNDTSIGMYSWANEDVNVNKLFRVIPYADGTYGFVCTVSNQYIDLDAGTCANGTKIHTWQSSMGGATQKWHLLPTTVDLTGDSYIIGAKDDFNLVISVAEDSKEGSANIQAAAASGSDSQRFQLIPYEDSYYLIQNTNSGRNLNVDNNGTANGTNVIQYAKSSAPDGDNELWSIIPHGDDTYSFVSKCNGLYLTLEGNELKAGTNISVWNVADTETAATRWTLTTHTHHLKDVVTAPTCTENGYTTHTCTDCGYSYRDAEIAALGHDLVLTSKLEATCSTVKSEIYTCSRCGETKTVLGQVIWTDWSENEPPAGTDADKIETRTAYRFRDYETTTSTAASLDGYDQISFQWQKTSDGSQDRAAFPAGYNTGDSLYSQYNKSELTAFENTTKRTIDSTATVGYIYWHWCAGYTNVDDDSLMNRYIDSSSSSERSTFHSYFSTTAPSTGVDTSDTTYPYCNAKNRSVCSDTKWFYYVPVTRQTYTDYEKLYTYGRYTDWSDWTAQEVASSETRQVETRTEYRYVSADSYGDHVYETVNVVAATCTEDGYTEVACKYCGATDIIDVVDALGHDLSVKVVHAPTCTEEGYTEISCSRCDYSDLSDFVDKVPHQFQDATDEEHYQAPTCTEEGLVYQVCTICGAEGEGRVLPATGHHIVTDAAQAATCTEEGKTEGSHCENCGMVVVAQTTIPATGHTVVVDKAVPVTCTTDGKTAGSHCSVCNAVIQRQEVISATGHTVVTDKAVAATCTAEGKTAGSHCSTCGTVLIPQDVIPAKGHQDGPVADNGDGTHMVFCSVCGSLIRTEAHTYVDGTCACGAKEAASEPTYDASLKFLSKSFTMGSSLNMVFIASKGTDTTRTIRAEVTKYNADGTTTVRTYTVADGNMNDQTRFVTFTFDGVAAKEMGDKVEAKLFATDASGNEFYGETLTLSLKDFLMNYAQSSNEAQKNLAVALLNYGAAAQVYFDYNYDGDATKLVNNDLTDEQKVIDIREASATTVVSGDGCKCLTNSVLLESKIVLYAIFNLGDYASRIDELAAVVTNAATGEEVTRLTLTKGSGTLASFRFDDVSAKNTRTVFNIAIYDGETKISQDLQWSMECMVSSYRAASNTPAEKLNLANAMLAYGDYAAAYLG